MEIVAPVPFWKRPEVSCIFWDNIEYQKSRGLNIEVVALVSDRLNELLAIKYTDHVVMTSNFNLGDKWNKGVEYCKELDFDYMLILGSDDIFSKDLIDLYVKAGCDYTGLRDATAISLISKNVRHFQGYRGLRQNESVGSGRLIKKHVVEKARYRLFKSLNKGLDYSTTQILGNLGIENRTLTTGLTPLRIGLKVPNSMSSIKGDYRYRLHELELEKHYSQSVIEQIKEF